MIINGNNLGGFLETSKQFYIPVFQRNYAWDTGDCLQLLNDINAIDPSSLHHFFGSICYIDEPDKYTIIDGQQRITTTMLLLAAIRDCFCTPKIKSMINDRYLVRKIYDDDGNVKFASKMILSKTDRDIFNKIINANESENISYDEEEKNLLYIKIIIIFAIM